VSFICLLVAKPTDTPVLDPPRRDPFAAALARSTSRRGPKGTFVEDLASSSREPLSSSGFLASPTRGTPEPQDQWGIKPIPSGYKCQIVIVAPPPPPEPVPQTKGSKEKPKPPAEPDHLIRANSLAGYWELNRRVIKSLAGSPSASGSGQGSQARGPQSQNSSSANEDNRPISALAQISPDSLIGESTRVAEKTSIKKCVIGRHCVIGKGAKLTGCVLWDFVVVEEKYISTHISAFSK
jgi:translation initiation factor eIF-2B subunit gamma